MRFSDLLRASVPRVALAALYAGAGATLAAQPPAAHAPASASSCPANDTGLELPPGFCATIFADGIGHARHMVAAADGVLYVNTWSGRYYVGAPAPPGGFLVALRDTSGSGKADWIRRFGPTEDTGGHGGTGIALYQGYLYAENNDEIIRYRLAPGADLPSGPPEVIVSGLPLTGDHPMHPFQIDASGWMYVDVATATNACQERNRMLESPGIKPCTELETRGGIWRFSATAMDQHFSPAQRYATGIRNADGIAIDSTGHGLFATQHGRDQLGQNWPKIYTVEQGAILPAEELVHVRAGGNYGWPYCYFDGVLGRLVLAPEYGGDGKRAGVCAHMRAPLAAFPAHWAPDDLLLYYGREFPHHFQGGAFIAFHGSWNRAPFPQQGYNVTFQPLVGGTAAGPCEVFADGFAGADRGPGAAHRPTGLAVGSDGVLYVSDDAGGRIYRISYIGGAASSDFAVRPCPSMTYTGASGGSANALPPEGIHPNAGASASLPVPRGSTRTLVALGDRIFHGAVGGAPCAGCHGERGEGTPLGPSLISGHWLWSDGSYRGVLKSIREGVPNPKKYRGAMPPLGGARLSSREAAAVAAYVWAIGHRPGP